MRRWTRWLWKKGWLEGVWLALVSLWFGLGEPLFHFHGDLILVTGVVLAVWTASLTVLEDER